MGDCSADATAASGRIEPVWIVAFSGHRPRAAGSDADGRSGEAIRACGPTLREVFAGLQRDAEAGGGRIEIFSGLAAGADLEAAEAAESLGLPLHVILPLPEPMFERDFDGGFEDAWPRAARLIARARAGEGGGTFRVADGDNERPACYHDANLQMIRSSDALVAVWNGERTGRLGGTDEAVAEATLHEMAVVVIDPASDAAVRRLGEHRGWPRHDPMLSELAAAVSAEGDLRPRGPEERGGEGPAWAAFVRLDEAGTASGRRFRARLLFSFGLHFLAALLAGVNAAYATLFEAASLRLWQFVPIALTVLEFVLVTIAWYTLLRARRQRVHRAWRTARFAAELADGIINAARLRDPLRPVILHRVPAWRRFAISLSLLAHRVAPEAGSEDRRDGCLRRRVMLQRDRYFREQQRGAALWKRWLRTIESWAAAGAVLVIFTAFWIKLLGGSAATGSVLGSTFALLLPVLLPLAAGAAGSLRVSLDAGRRAKRYRLMADRLDRVARQAARTRTPGALGRVVHEAEDVLLDELIEWHAASGEMGHRRA